MNVAAPSQAVVGDVTVALLAVNCSQSISDRVRIRSASTALAIIRPHPKRPLSLRRRRHLHRRPLTASATNVASSLPVSVVVRQRSPSAVCERDERECVRMTVQIAAPTGEWRRVQQSVAKAAELRRLKQATAAATAAAAAAAAAASDEKGGRPDKRERITLPQYDQTIGANPFFHRFEEFYKQSKEHTMRMNALLWHATDGKEITVRRLFELLTDDELRGEWYVCAAVRMATTNRGTDCSSVALHAYRSCLS